MARRVSSARIKVNRSYTVEEAASTVGVTEQTIRAWIKRGLPALQAQRPTLILGSELKVFLGSQRAPKSRPLQIGEFYCLSCKAPRKAALGMVDYQPVSATTGRLEAFCEDCEGACSRIVNVSALALWSVSCRGVSSIRKSA